MAIPRKSAADAAHGVARYSMAMLDIGAEGSTSSRTMLKGGVCGMLDFACGGFVISIC
jgi:hypothetical protein